jgi:hypothetical protein
MPLTQQWLQDPLQCCQKGLGKTMPLTSGYKTHYNVSNNKMPLTLIITFKSG